MSTHLIIDPPAVQLEQKQPLIQDQDGFLYTSVKPKLGSQIVESTLDNQVNQEQRNLEDQQKNGLNKYKFSDNESDTEIEQSTRVETSINQTNNARILNNKPNESMVSTPPLPKNNGKKGKKTQKQAQKQSDEILNYLASMSSTKPNLPADCKTSDAITNNKTTSDLTDEPTTNSNADSKKLTKNQLKKQKEKEKKANQTEQQSLVNSSPVSQNPTSKQVPLSKVAQAALEKVSNSNKRKEEEEARRKAELQQEEEELQKAKILQQISKEKSGEIVDPVKSTKSKIQIKKERDELTRKLLISQMESQTTHSISTIDSVTPPLKPSESLPNEVPKKQKKKKAERDIFGQIITSDDESHSTSSKPTHERDYQVPQYSMSEMSESAQSAPITQTNTQLTVESQSSSIEQSISIIKMHRQPIISILGHVDTGKTSLLNKIRNANERPEEISDGQSEYHQIGATHFTRVSLAKLTAKCTAFYPQNEKEDLPPGFLFLDQPNMQSSYNNIKGYQRLLAPSDFAIVVIDIMHGLELQTIEQLNYLNTANIPYVIALNKIDRIYNWKCDNTQNHQQLVSSCYESLKAQPNEESKAQFMDKLNIVKQQLESNCISGCLPWEESGKTDCSPNSHTFEVPIIPTSAITGEGIPELLSVLTKHAWMQYKKKQPTRIEGHQAFKCIVMDLKRVEGFGNTIDVILVEGTLKKDDRICVITSTGPIITKIRAILSPHRNKEKRIKGEYESHLIVHASLGIRIVANDLESVLIGAKGSQLYLANTPVEESTALSSQNAEMFSIIKTMYLKPKGVTIAAATLESLIGLAQFLHEVGIPVAAVSIGNVQKDSITKSMKEIMLDDVSARKKELGCLLALNVTVMPDAIKLADDNHIKLIHATTVFEIQNLYNKFVQECQRQRKEIEGKLAIFPCLIQPIAFFHRTEPLIIGVEVLQGVLKPGTPLCVYDESKLRIGIVQSMELEKKTIVSATKDTGRIAIRIKRSGGNLLAGRQFTESDQLVSVITKESIDMLKEHFSSEITKEQAILIKDLKSFFQIYR